MIVVIDGFTRRDCHRRTALSRRHGSELGLEHSAGATKAEAMNKRI
jgi:hypothetical protein